MRRPGVGFRPAWIGLPALGALTYVSPIAGAAATGLATTAIAYTIAQPITVVAVTAVLTTAVPKAGLNLGSFPLPVALIGLLAAVPYLRRLAVGPRSLSPVAVLAAGWLALRLVMMQFDGGGLADFFALIGWYGLPLLLIMGGPTFGSLRGETGRLWAKWLETGILVSSLYAVVQFVFGVGRTAIPGLTRAIGTDYSRKPLQFAGGSKIPSTYQNGNILGVATAFFFLVVADRFIRGHARNRRDGVLLMATASATLLSGSRTAVLGLVLGIVVLVARSRLSRRTIGVCLALGVSMLAVLTFSPALASRLFGTRANDPNVTGRTTSWSAVLHTSSTWNLLVGGSTWVEEFPEPGQAEGVVGAVQQVGLVGVALLAATLVLATSSPRGRRWRVLLIPVAVSMMVDSAYLVFPTLFIPIARMYAPLSEEEDSDFDRRGSVGRE